MGGIRLTFEISPRILHSPAQEFKVSKQICVSTSQLKTINSGTPAAGNPALQIGGCEAAQNEWIVHPGKSINRAYTDYLHAHIHA